MSEFGKAIQERMAYVALNYLDEHDKRMAMADDERAAYDAAKHQREQEQRDRERAEVKAEHDAVMAGATGLRRAVLKMHAPSEYRECKGCEPGEYAASCAMWPCPTYELARGWTDN